MTEIDFPLLDTTEGGKKVERWMLDICVVEAMFGRWIRRSLVRWGVLMMLADS